MCTCVFECTVYMLQACVLLVRVFLVCMPQVCVHSRYVFLIYECSRYASSWCMCSRYMFCEGMHGL